MAGCKRGGGEAGAANAHQEVAFVDMEHGAVRPVTVLAFPSSREGTQWDAVLWGELLVSKG